MIRSLWRPVAVSTAAAAALCITGTHASAATPGSVSITAEHNSSTGAVAVPGVVFQVQRLVGIDPDTPQGFAWLATAQKCPTVATGKPVSGVWWTSATDAAGNASLSGLPDGVYVVRTVQPVDGLLWGPMVVGVDDADGHVVVAVPKPLPVLPVVPSSLVAPSATSSQDHGPSRPEPGPSPTTVPIGPGINAGDGADFTGNREWAAIVFSVAAVVVVFVATRRRKRDAGEGS